MDIENTTLKDKYRACVSGLMKASELIDNTKGVSKREAKIDFIMAQLNLLNVQNLMILEALNKIEGGKDE